MYQYTVFAKLNLFIVKAPGAYIYYCTLKVTIHVKGMLCEDVEWIRMSNFRLLCPQ